MESSVTKKWLQGRTVKLVVVIVIIFVSGYLLGLLTHKRSSIADRPYDKPAVSQKWTCSMHPQIITDKPGKCPICGMDLVPVTTEAGGVSERQITFSEDALKLMEIQTTPVQRKLVEAEIRMVGKVDYDETRIKNITAWVPGRIDRLFVDFTGITVNKGDHMVYLYSPQLISAQAELLQALKAAENIKTDTSDLVKSSTLATLEAVREKLRLLGLSPEQIENIGSSGEPQTHITIHSPISGIVIHKNATEGMYVETGTQR